MVCGMLAAVFSALCFGDLYGFSICAGRAFVQCGEWLMVVEPGEVAARRRSSRVHSPQEGRGEKIRSGGDSWGGNMVTWIVALSTWAEEGILQSSLHRKGKTIRSGGDRGDLVSSLHSLLEASGILGGLGGVLSSGRKEGVMNRGDKYILDHGVWREGQKFHLQRTIEHISTRCKIRMNLDFGF